MRQWRLILSEPASGAWNMSVDEAVLESVQAGSSLPTLRLYAWSPPCLSLGYAQKSSDVDLLRLHQHGWDIIRRPTGGRAILHTDELTYSVMLPLDDELAAGGVIESYRCLSKGLIAGMQLLGANVNSDHQQSRAVSGPVCFEVPSHYELTVGGRKLVGSAQMRRAGALLQHGSIPLTGDITRIAEALVYPDESERAASRLVIHSRALTLSEALGSTHLSWEHAAHAIMEGFSAAFDIQFEHQPLSPAELNEAERLLHITYGNPEHTFKR